MREVVAFRTAEDTANDQFGVGRRRLILRVKAAFEF